MRAQVFLRSHLSCWVQLTSRIDAKSQTRGIVELRPRTHSKKQAFDPKTLNPEPQLLGVCQRQFQQKAISAVATTRTRISKDRIVGFRPLGFGALGLQGLGRRVCPQSFALLGIYVYMIVETVKKLQC